MLRKHLVVLVSLLVLMFSLTTLKLYSSDSLQAPNLETSNITNPATNYPTFEGGFSGSGLTSDGGHSSSFSLKYYVEENTNKDQFLVVKGELAESGLHVKLTSGDYSVSPSIKSDNFSIRLRTDLVHKHSSTVTFRNKKNAVVYSYTIPALKGLRYEPSNGEVPVGDEGYTIVMRDKKNKPVTWNTCKPINFVINLKDSPPGAEDFIKNTMLEVEKQTGIRFKYKGVTSNSLQKQKKLFGKNHWKNDSFSVVTIVWQNSNPSNQEVMNDDVLAWGGFNWTGRYILSGFVAFNTKHFNSGLEITPIQKTVLLHELGHVLNLGHTEHDDQIMNANTDYPYEQYQDKDMVGISKIKKNKC